MQSAPSSTLTSERTRGVSVLGYTLAGVLAFVVFLEVLFRVLPVSTSTETGYYIHPLILTYPAHHRFVSSGGWNLENAQRHVANNFGFVAAQEFSPDEQAIAVIGDSYAESAMLPPPDRPDAQLERAAGRRVFAMGGPGSNLMDYAERIKLARERLKVRDFVVLIEMGDLRQSLCGSNDTHGVCLQPPDLETITVTQPPPSTLKRIMRNSALAQYLFSQLKINVGELLSIFREPAPPAPTTAAPPPDPREMPAERVNQILQRFVERMERKEGERVTFVLDSERARIYQGKPASTPTRDALMAVAREQGIAVVDTEPLFRSFYEQTGKHLEVSPRDGHWNSAAIGLVTGAAAGVLSGR
jgi:hypothetical protein